MIGIDGGALKRFWKVADVESGEHGFQVLLDGRAIKTPAKTPLHLPTLAAADLVCAEWNAIGERVDPTIMPATRWANSAIDKVTPQRLEIIDMLAEYGGTDLLCYRATSPASLIERQEQVWNPFLDWAKTELDAPLAVTSGIIPISQTNQSVVNLRSQLLPYTVFELAAVHDLITVSGSLVIGLAVAKGKFSAQKGLEAAFVDEQWQADLWGQDEDAEVELDLKRQAFVRAQKYLRVAQN